MTISGPVKPDSVKPGPVKSGPVKRSMTIRGHRTSISLEAPFWRALRDAAAEEGLSLAALVARIDGNRAGAGPGTGLSSAVRVYLLERRQG